MSDFEKRLRQALDDAVTDPGDVSGLASGARRRARERRRTTLVTTAAVAVLAVVAVPVGFGAFAGDDPAREPAGPGPSASDTPTDSPTNAVPDGWRTESWRDLEIHVPRSWGYGNLSTWCIDHEKPGDPVVERPGGAVAAILCQGPGSGYGARFLDTSLMEAAYSPGQLEQINANPGGEQQYPVGSWFGYEGTGDAGVIVVAPTEGLARQIMDSAHRIEGVDSNGCAPTADAPAPAAVDGTVSVCRYDADGRLEQSERLSGDDGAAALAAVREAPVRGDQESCTGTSDVASEVRIGAGPDLGTVRVVWDTECAAGRGVFLSGVVRELTADVMYWALSPGWSGGVDGSVPLPDQLRR